MKMTPELVQASEKMKPGQISKDGFLGTDDRPLVDILEDQTAECARLGISHEDLGEKMESIAQAGMKGLGESVVLDDTWEITADENRGKIPCPFPHPGVFQKTVYTVKNLRTAKTIRFTELSIHMIKAHCFFQGPGAPFYNSPAALVEVLEIGPST